MKRRLQWLGHVARMSDKRIPKMALFGWLPLPRPSYGPKRRWRDVVKRDMQQANISVNTWYDEAQHRGKWFEAWKEGVAQL